MSIADSLYSGNAALRYPHLFEEIERRVSLDHPNDELTGSSNYFPEQYTTDTLVSRFLDIDLITIDQVNAGNPIGRCQVWWLQNPRQWIRIRLVVQSVLLYNPFYQDPNLLTLLIDLSRGEVPLLNVLLDHCLADQAPANGGTTVNIVAHSKRGAIDLLGLDLQSKNLTVAFKTEHDDDRDLVKNTGVILRMGCPLYRQNDVAIEARLTGLACKVRLRGRVCVQKHMALGRRSAFGFFSEIEAFMKLRDGTRVAEFVGVVLDSRQ